MRRKRDYTDYVRDILDAAQKAERFIAGVEFEAFQANDEKVFAVIRPLKIIGEASKRIPPSRPVTACAICCPRNSPLPASRSLPYTLMQELACLLTSRIS